MNAAAQSQLEKDVVSFLLSRGQLAVGPVDLTQVVMTSSPTSQVISKPDGMDWITASKYCKSKHDEQESVTNILQTWVTFPWVLGVAVEEVLKKYSTTAGKTIQISVPGKGGVTRNCTWGEFEIASLGTITLDASYNKALRRPECTVVLKHARKNAERAKTLLEEINVQVEAAAWIKGVALQLAIDANGIIDIFAPPQVVNVPNITSAEVVLPAHLKAEIEAGVLFPLRNPEICQKAGLSARRGSLFAGRPGTGKTMCARLATRVAIDNQWGALYITDSRALEQALNIAAALAPCLVVCEDIDRQLGVERDAATDRILNALDGLDRSKSVALICTSNAVETLPPALLRAGRLDTILIFDLPDADAARTLVSRYLGKYAPESLGDTGCAGLLPASIKEVAQRAILHALAAQAEGSRAVVTERMVQNCARMVRAQQTILEDAEKPREREINTTTEVVFRRNAKQASAVDELSESLRNRGELQPNGKA